MGVVAVGVQLGHDRLGFAQLGEGESYRASVQLLSCDVGRLMGFHVGSQRAVSVTGELGHSIDV